VRLVNVRLEPLGVLLVDDGRGYLLGARVGLGQRSVQLLPYRVSATPDGATT
jgi:hypothetical protein